MGSESKNATPIMQQKKMYKNACVQGEPRKDVFLASFHFLLVRATNNKRCCVRCSFTRAGSFHALQCLLQDKRKFGRFRKAGIERLIIFYSGT